MDCKNKYSCIFGGGAIRGLAYVGAIKALKELSIDIDIFVGSSVGAIVASLLAVGYNEYEIKELFLEVNFELFKDIHFGLKKNFAISKGNVFTDWLRDAIEKKYYGNNYKKGENAPVRFKDIANKLIILTTDLNKFEPFEFSIFTTPEFEIASAVRISCSMPGLMTPVEYEGKNLVDGDLLKGTPLWKLSPNICTCQNRVLEFRLEGERLSDDDNTFDFINSIYSCMTSASTNFIIDTYVKNDKYDYVKITTGDILIVNFNINNDIRNKIIEIGYNDTMNYFKNFGKKKKLEIIQYYSELIKHIRSLKRELKYNNVEKSVSIIKNMFVYLSDVNKYIDNDIYNDLWTLKNDILSAELTKSWLKKVKFKNRTNLITSAEVLEKVVNIKNDELKNYIDRVS